MSGMQSKFTKHSEKQENIIHTNKKNPTNKTNPELTQMLELEENYIKIIIIPEFSMYSLCSKHWKKG